MNKKSSSPRWIPIVSGIMWLVVALGIITVFGFNIITILIGVIPFSIGMRAFTTGFHGSNNLINDMVSPNPTLSQKSKKELKKIYVLNDKKIIIQLLNLEEFKSILFTVLEKYYSEEELLLYKESDSAILATPHYTYLCLLDKWFIYL